jgi:Arc/MetJ-type ribon-helix-helix transcriptional regulator
MPRNDPNERFSVSLPTALARAIRAEADRNYDGNLSAALAAVIEQWAQDDAVRVEGLAAMQAYQAEHGQFTEAEQAAAKDQVAAEMGWETTDSRLDRFRPAA